MIFSEIYGLYFRTVEKLIEKAIENKLNETSFYEIINDNAFSESILFIDNKIKNGNWKVIDGNYKTPFEFVPKMPLTVLELRFLKTITLDNRFALFCYNIPPWLNNIEPLFDIADVIFPDRFKDGDNYEDENYQNIFHTIITAFKNKKTLNIEFVSGKGYSQKGEFIPIKLEYSGKEDKFRLYTGNIFKNCIINIGRIKKCSIGENFSEESLIPLKPPKGEVEFIIVNERNCLERALIHFSSYEKETIRLDRKTFKVRMKYNLDDETEIIIRILQFGQFIKVIGPPYFVNQIKERITCQKSCEV